MGNYKHITWIIILLILVFFVACPKKGEVGGVEKPAIVVIKDAPVYDSASGDVLVTSLDAWIEVACLNSGNPKKIEGTSEVIDEKGNKETITGEIDWYKIQIPGKDVTGWTRGENLLFQQEEVQEAIILDKLWLYPIPGGSFKETIVRGDTVTYLGYTYHVVKRNNNGVITSEYDVHKIRTIDDSEYWSAPASRVLPGAQFGVMLEEKQVFKLPDNKKQNIVKDKDGEDDLLLKKMELVPVLDKGKDGYIKILLTAPSRKEYYVYAKSGNPISYKDEDIALVSFVKDAYYDAKPIIEELDKAINEDNSANAKAEVANKAAKVKILTESREIIEKNINNSDFSGSSFKAELIEYIKDISETKNILETELEHNKSSIPEPVISNTPPEDEDVGDMVEDQ